MKNFRKLAMQTSLFVVALACSNESFATKWGEFFGRKKSEEKVEPWMPIYQRGSGMGHQFQMMGGGNQPSGRRRGKMRGRAGKRLGMHRAGRGMMRHGGWHKQQGFFNPRELEKKIKELKGKIGVYEAYAEKPSRSLKKAIDWDIAEVKEYFEEESDEKILSLLEKKYEKISLKKDLLKLRIEYLEDLLKNQEGEGEGEGEGEEKEEAGEAEETTGGK